MIAGIGIDIVDIARVQEKFSRNKNFKKAVFSVREIAYCEQEQSGERYAARFAAKEAFLKATGMGLTLTHELTSIEVLNDDRGQPRLQLTGSLEDYGKSNHWSAIHVSLSHTQTAACAVVIIEK